MLRTAIAAVIGVMSLNSFAGFEALSDVGTPVLRQCTGIPDPVTGIAPTPTQCDAEIPGPAIVPDLTLNGSANGSAFPGQAGTWALVAAQTGVSIMANGTLVGTLEDRVWKRVGSTEHIFGMRIVLNSNTWTEPNDDNLGLAGTNNCNLQSGQFFEVNDMFRNGFTGKTGLTVAFRLSTVADSEEGLFVSGRTNQGRAQVAVGADAVRNNDFVNFRTDANFNDPDPTTRGNSKWMYVKTTSAKTVWSASASALRLEEGGEESQCKYRVTLNGFKP